DGCITTPVLQAPRRDRDTNQPLMTRLPGQKTKTLDQLRIKSAAYVGDTDMTIPIATLWPGG
ncbi:MAG: hypothetical protein ACK53Y_25735, partial [bacterium]